LLKFEIVLREKITSLLGRPEKPAMGKRSAKSVGASPASLYIYVENVDKVVEKAIQTRRNSARSRG
jgi:hypothetical protein